MSTGDKDSPAVVEAVSKITAKGNEIKAIKDLKAPTMKEDIAPLVQELLALKDAYKELTGEDFGPPAKKDAKPKKEKPLAQNKTNKNKKDKVGEDDKTMGIDEIRKVRISKMNDIKEQGFNPFEYTYKQTHKAVELQEMYKDLADSSEDEQADVAVAGTHIYIHTYIHACMHTYIHMRMCIPA